MNTTAYGLAASCEILRKSSLWSSGNVCGASYGVQGSAVFFVKQLGFSQEQAAITFGAFALVYGLISSATWATVAGTICQRTLVLGAIVLAIGCFMTGMLH